MSTSRSQGSRSRRRGGARPGPALGLGLALAPLLLGGCGRGEELPLMQGHRTAQQLLTSGAEREVVREAEDDPVRMETVAHRIDDPARAGRGSVLRVLRATPEAEVRWRVPRVDERAVLRFGFGWHAGEARAGAEPWAVRFEVLLDGSVVRDETLEVPADAEELDARWVEGEVPLPPRAGGGEVAIRTSRAGAGPVPPGLTVGFDRLEVALPLDVRRTRATAGAPNVVLIVADTLRADRLSCYGYAKETSPAVDELAEDGLLFESAWSAASWTWPSTASLFTALSPPEHGVLSHEACYLAEDLGTLAEALQDAGWTTAGFSTNPLITAGQNYDQGFETFWESPWARSPALLDAVDPVLEELAPYRFFLYLHPTDPHRPYEPEAELAERFAPDPPAGYSTATLRALTDVVLAFEPVPEDQLQRWIGHSSDLYDAEIASLDRSVERLRARLVELGVAERTVIAFTSDHGEEFLEHGQLVHGRQLYEETLRVPLVLAGPGVPRGARVARPVENRFLAPTLLRLVGVEPRGNLRGEDLFALVGKPAGEPPLLFFSTELGVQEVPGRRSLSAVRTATEHFVWGPAAKDRPELERYYLLATDPGTHDDVAAAHRVRVEDLKSRIRNWWTDGASRRPEVLGGGAGAEELLQGLGYIGKDDD